MDIYNRWLMRASGEAKHQAFDAAEASTFAAMDVIRRNDDICHALGKLSEEKKNEIMEEMCGNIGRAISINS